MQWVLAQLLSRGYANLELQYNQQRPRTSDLSVVRAREGLSTRKNVLQGQTVDASQSFTVQLDYCLSVRIHDGEL